MKRRILSLMLTLTVVLTYCVPISVYAAEGSPALATWAADQTSLTAAGGAVTITMTGENLSGLSKSDFTFEEKGAYGYMDYYDSPMTYTATDEENATLTFTLPANSSSDDHLYRITAERGADALSNNKIIFTVKSGVPAPAIATMTANQTSFDAAGGEVTVTLTGENLTSLKKSDFQMEEKGTWGYMDTYDVSLTYTAQSASQAMLRFTLPENKKESDFLYRLTAKKGADTLSSNNLVFTVAGAAAAAQPKITSMTADQTSVTSEGGVVTVTLEGEGLTGLKKSDFTIEEKGTYGYMDTYDVSMAYSAANDASATITLNLPANAKADDMLYRLTANKGADSINNRMTFTVKTGVAAPTITSMTADKTTVDAAGGNIVISLVGENLNSLKKSDFQIEEKSTYGYMDTYDVMMAYSASSATEATLTLMMPENTKDADQLYRLTAKKGADALANKVMTLTVSKVAATAEPKIDSWEADQTRVAAQGGTVNIKLSGEGLTGLKKSDFTIEEKGTYGYMDTYDVPMTYTAASDASATITLNLPANTKADDMLYRLTANKGADSINNRMTFTVRTGVAAPAITSMTADKTSVTSAGGNIVISLTGENLTSLKKSDFQIEEKGTYGYLDTYDVAAVYAAASDSEATLTLSMPANAKDADQLYRVTAKKGADALTNKTIDLVVSKKAAEEPAQKTFNLGVDDFDAVQYSSNDGSAQVVITIKKYDSIALNPAVEDIKDSIYFGNGYDESGDYHLAADEDITVDGNKITLNVKNTKYIGAVLFIKKGALINPEGEVLGKDEFNRDVHKTYLKVGAHADSIRYSAITFDSEGGTLTATMEGTNLTMSTPAISAHVYVNDENKPSDVVTAKTKVDPFGYSATFTVELPKNTTGKTVSYRLMPVVNGTEVYPVYLKGFDTIAVLPEGQTDDGTPRLASVELTGAGDTNSALNVYETAMQGANYTVKVDAIIRGTNLHSKTTKIKIVDENGVVWPVTPVYECGATVRWQNSSEYLPEKESTNQQSIELLAPRHLGEDHTFQLYFAVDGENYSETPDATLILHNDGIWSAENGFSYEELTELQQVNVKYVDEQGKEISPSAQQPAYGVTELYTIEASQREIEGYTFKDCNVDLGWFAQPTLRTDGSYEFPNGEHFVRDLKGQDIVFTYTKNATTEKPAVTPVKKVTPKATSLRKLKPAKKKMTVLWKKQTVQTSGYQIQYSTSKKFAKSKTKAKYVKSNKTTKTTIKKLKSKKTYYVRIRTYKKVGGKNVFSKWSKVKKTKIK